MLAYAHINLLSMLSRFTPDEAVRVAIDIIYVRKSALKKLQGVEAFEGGGGFTCPDKGEKLYMPMEHAAYLAEFDYFKYEKDLTPSTAPRHDGPLSRHRLSYQNGGGGSGKTMRAIELFRQRNPLVFTLTHRLAKEMRTRGVQAQTYHSFFRWSGQTEWTPERMGQKFIPRVIIWDEVCTVLRPTLEAFLDWLEGRGVQVI
ncbi:MAG: AAA family ATPase [Candidatus Thiodiazotropha sp.]